MLGTNASSFFPIISHDIPMDSGSLVILSLYPSRLLHSPMVFPFSTSAASVLALATITWPLSNMRILIVIVASLSVCTTAALQPRKRALNATTDDGFVLNFALTIEYLQRAFYEGGLDSFSQSDYVTAGFEDPFYDNLQQIYSDEQSHAILLQNILIAGNIEPTGPLQYEFPYVDVASFVALASIIEGVSVSA